MNRKQQVFVKLKLKAKALGFNKKELQGIAAKIADNLKSEEDASEEDVNAEIDEQIEAVLPYLTFGQSQANRLLDEWKKNHPDPDDDADDDDDDDTSGQKQQRQTGSKKNPQNKGKNDDDAPEWAKGMVKTIETLTGKITALEGEKKISEQKAKLEAVLKDTGAFGTRTLKSFSKMKFENDDEFDEFISEVEADLKAYNQERANAGLSTLGNPPGAVGVKQKEEPLSDAEIDALADL